MNTRTSRKAAVRQTTTALAAISSALTLAACGALGGNGVGSGSASPRRDDIKVGLLLPDRDTARFEKFDYPIIKKQVDSLTHGKGKVVYANAEASVEKQSQQFQRLVEQKVDIILVDAVDAKRIAPDVQKSKDAGIPVIAYDRLAEGPIDAYISHDNELVGQVQGRAIVEALDGKGSSSKVVMMNGDPADPNTARFKEGALGELDGKVDIVKQYDTDKWSPAVAKAHMKEAIQSVGLTNIAAVYSANDGMAGAAIDALKEAGASKIPPVTGQDANLDAVQRIVAGQQYMTVYKSFLEEATNAAEMAVNKVQGRDIAFDALTRDKVDSPTQKDIPAMLVPVVSLTKNNIKDTVIADGVYTVRQICTQAYASDCAAIGLK
ncbi:sugar ABC transporter substrate-binding protein [Streptomyces olivochromogenes]|uniref:sugar ABC transporter substrate-binding protein n=1 Tax=Streptomyces olivochromogenes TaxID=1963 RepID=UPI001F3F2B2F|nr:substrate-binding domain-containing protein [Streptomyces olivochromogenes]MCF3135697.1 substrate-binding domain-containing protein [Streptomyces olivochromogenes]